MQAAGALRGVDVQRITFTEVTQQAVRQALGAPRTISQELVDAYRARRALDYLYGFTLSPLLWRKLPGSKSAGNGMLGLGWQGACQEGWIHSCLVAIAFLTAAVSAGFAIVGHAI